MSDDTKDTTSEDKELGKQIGQAQVAEEKKEEQK